MSQGVLIFAQNNGSIDYNQLAVEAAKRVKFYLEKPISIVTNDKPSLLKLYPESESLFDKIIEERDLTKQEKRFYDGSIVYTKMTWKNQLRIRTYDISPYKETLVIDADYLISSDVLNGCWNSPDDFLIYRDSVDLTFWRKPDEFKILSEKSIDFYWATVFYFKKTPKTEMFFNFIKHIHENWTYYKLIYEFESSMFRNDHAFSIAVHLVNGFLDGDFGKSLPGKMYYVTDRDILCELKNDKMKFLVEKQDALGQYVLIKTQGLDVHVMNKKSLIRMYTK